MSNYVDRIKPDDKSIYTYLDDLRSKKYQIPTFQRDVVWERDNVKKLWDSIYKFYPMGSILIWKTDVKLHNHRAIGGHVIASESLTTNEYQYILDGQQRTTSLLTSIYGGKIEGKEGFDPSLYIDLTIENQSEIDDENYKKRFLFWDEIDDRGGELKKNTGRKKKFNKGLIVKLKDIKQKFGDIENSIQEKKEYRDYSHPVRVELRKIREVLDNYRISLIVLKGIKVSEVCQIFERVNQEGAPLSIFDIIVAKTYKPKIDNCNGFYLREIIDNFKQENNSNYLGINDIDYLQMLAVLINKNVNESGVLNITDKYLNNITHEQIEEIWESAKTAILKTFDFLENYLRLKGPQLVPYRYFYLTLVFYFYKNKHPDYDFLKQYFWYYSFHNEDLLSNTNDLWKHIDFLSKQKNGKEYSIERFLLDKNKLRLSSYSSKGRLSRAILSLYANQDPKDWKNIDRSVLSDVYYILTDKPNLHHVFPMNFVKENPSSNKVSENSLMNIVYLTQITNLEISDENPLIYLRDYDNPGFDSIADTHLLPKEILEWSRDNKMPENSLDLFIEKRIDNIVSDLKKKITFTKFDVIDTKEQEDKNNHRYL